MGAMQVTDNIYTTFPVQLYSNYNLKLKIKILLHGKKGYVFRAQEGIDGCNKSH